MLGSKNGMPNDTKLILKELEFQSLLQGDPTGVLFEIHFYFLLILNEHPIATLTNAISYS